MDRKTGHPTGRAVERAQLIYERGKFLGPPESSRAANERTCFIGLQVRK